MKPLRESFNQSHGKREEGGGRGNRAAVGGLLLYTALVDGRRMGERRETKVDYYGDTTIPWEPPPPRTLLVHHGV